MIKTKQMIAANELRIGNWVKLIGLDKEYFFTKIDNITKEGVNFLVPDSYGETTNEFIYDEVFPIPLTPEILEKAGFKEGDMIRSNKYFYSIVTNRIEVSVNPNNGITYISKNEADIKLNRKIAYIHQLQNLYFSLTGEELEIKL